MYRAAARLLAAMICVVGVAACTDPGPGPRPSTTRPTPPARQILFRYTATGGNCPVGQCGTELTLYRGGAWEGRAGPRAAEGQLEGAALRQVTQRIEREIGTLADLKPAPELCPSAYDGADLTYTFHVGARPVTATNCDPRDHRRNKDVPGDNALLVSMTELVNQLLATAPAGSELLVEYRESGGHCRETCPVETARIGADGAWEATSGETSTRGTLTGTDTADLARRIAAQAGSLDRLPPSTGCPSAYDGRDIEITFHLNGREVSVSNCTKNFEADPLIDHTLGIIDSFF